MKYTYKTIWFILLLVVVVLHCDQEQSGKKTANETPVSNALLKSIEVNSGGLSPSFSGTTLEYTLNLDTCVNEFVISATPEDISSQVSINGQRVAIGESIILNVAELVEDTVTITVIARDALKSTVYRIVVKCNTTNSNNSLVDNPSFEDTSANGAEGWEVVKGPEEIGVSLTSGTPFGKKCVYFTSLTQAISGRELQSQPFKINNGQPLICSVYAKSDLEPDRTRLGFKISYYTDSSCETAASEADDYMSAVSLTQQNSWEEVSYKFKEDTIPVDAHFARISIRCMYVSGVGEKTDRLYLDNLNVIQN